MSVLRHSGASVHFEAIEWDEANLGHAGVTHSVSPAEIDQAIMNMTRVKHNKKGKSATHVLFGRTNGGRALRIFVAYCPETYTIRPITAWEDQ